MTINPYELVQRLIQRGEEWAELNAAASWLEESAKSVMDQIALVHIEDGCSVAKAEKLARGDGVYKDHLKAMVEARAKANKAKVNYDGGKQFIELTRTLESTRREEIKKGM